MPSGEDAEAAASKLQARMRGKAARQEVADMKASKEAAAAEAPAPAAAESDEEEDVLSGEDAEAAASKLQAYIRGRAAREEVADMKAAAAEAPAPAADEVVEEEMPSGEDADAAASKLQARMRGKAARQEVADMRAEKDKEFLKELLSSVGLAVYTDKMFDAGVVSLEEFAKITEESMIAIGIDKKGHRKKVSKLVEIEIAAAAALKAEEEARVRAEQEAAAAEAARIKAEEEAAAAAEAARVKAGEEAAAAAALKAEEEARVRAEQEAAAAEAARVKVEVEEEEETPSVADSERSKDVLVDLLVSSGLKMYIEKLYNGGVVTMEDFTAAKVTEESMIAMGIEKKGHRRKISRLVEQEEEARTGALKAEEGARIEQESTASAAARVKAEEEAAAVADQQSLKEAEMASKMAELQAQIDALAAGKEKKDQQIRIVEEAAVDTAAATNADEMSVQSQGTSVTTRTQESSLSTGANTISNITSATKLTRKMERKKARVREQAAVAAAKNGESEPQVALRNHLIEKGVGLEIIDKIFNAGVISMEAFAKVTEESMTEMGIEKKAHRKKLLKIIASSGT